MTPFTNWRVENDNSNWFVTGNIAPGKRARIAVGLDEDTARLIAAAPTLLEALKEALDWIETEFALPSGNFENPDMTDLVRQVRAAISLATGETK